MPETRTFDPTRPIAMAAFGTLRGFRRNAGDPVTVVDDPLAAGEVTLEEATRLFDAGRLVYAEDARPTPVETPGEAAERLAVLEPLGNDRYLLRAPWLGEGETIHGAQAAADRRAEVVQAGVDAYTSTAEVAGVEAAAGAIGGDAFDLKEAGSNGWYEISGPGMEKPERVRGLANAEQRLAELRGAAAGPTTEVDPPAGSDAG